MRTRDKIIRLPTAYKAVETQKWRSFIFAILVLALSCRKPYEPKAIVEANSTPLLVVEGFINSGNDSTIIKLNRTVKLSGSTSVNPELGATVTIEGDDNSSRQLTTEPRGIYVSPGLNLDPSRNYRLKIRTSNGKEYASDFVPVLVAPAIDSLSYKVKSDGVDIDINTHDTKNATRYYRWDYSETWVFTSAFQSLYKSNGDTVLRRDLVNDQIYTCWQTENSSTIVLGSSAKLSQDVIADQPVTFVSRHSIKLQHKYSILVHQYALTEKAYDFWQNLKKNTEQLGGIFDAQPSQINGNIHCTSDPSEPVIGFISIGTATEKRIFVDQRNLPAWLENFNDGCIASPYLYEFKDTNSGAIVNQVDQYINYNKATLGPIIPIEGIQPPGAPKPLGYMGSSPACVDCTLRGTNKQPAFWQ
ncbi:MAG TPA: DUF4249 domain-containing protein [Mucilaginibacter sp.]|nr:DUF4249 domain-containing protein [Mucilaginibacter sp.]